MAGDRLTIAATALIHTLFATFIVGAVIIGAVSESIGVLTKDPRYERLSHSIARTVVLISAAVSFFGVMLVVFLTILWPTFWTLLFRIMFWPLIFEASFFLGEAVCLYTWYYSWGRWKHAIHLGVAWLGAFFSVIAMVMIDIVASFLLTPRPPLSVFQKMVNPTMVQLTLHRFAGNLSWAGFGLAALCALRYLRAEKSEERAYQEWAGAFCLLFGFGFLLLMPIVGFSYLKAVRFAAEGAFNILMIGEKSWIFVLQVLLVDLLLLAGSWYMFRIASFYLRGHRIFLRYRLPAMALMILAAILFVMPYQVRYIPFARLFTSAETNPLGKMQPYKYIAMGVLVGFGILNYGFYLGALRYKKEWGNGGTLPQILLLSLAGMTILSMLNMGYAREASRAPYLIYGQMLIEGEAPAGEGTPLEKPSEQAPESTRSNKNPADSKQPAGWVVPKILSNGTIDPAPRRLPDSGLPAPPILQPEQVARTASKVPAAVPASGHEQRPSASSQ